MNIILAFILLAFLIGIGLVVTKFIPKERDISNPELNSVEGLLERKKDNNLKAPIFFFSLLIAILFASWIFDSSYDKMVENKLFASVKEDDEEIFNVSLQKPTPPKVKPPKPKLDKPKPPVKEPDIVEVKKKPIEKKEPIELPDLDDELPTDDGEPGEEEGDPPTDDNIYFPGDVSVIPNLDGINDYLTLKLQGLKPPAKYKLQGKMYRLIVSFVVEKDGSLSNIQIGRRYRDELSDSQEKQIIDAFKNMPKWEPGQRIDKPVRIRTSQPIVLSP